MPYKIIDIKIRGGQKEARVYLLDVPNSRVDPDHSKSTTNKIGALLKRKFNIPTIKMRWLKKAGGLSCPLLEGWVVDKGLEYMEIYLMKVETK